MSTSTNDPLIGKQLGDYLIQGLLGQGGMARVYKGYDSKLDRFSAVKVIEPHLVSSEDSDEYRERFLREARAIARLNHPSVVSIFQFGQDPEETLYYMAMGFIEGQDLRHILKEHTRSKKSMSRAQILSVMRDIASALDFAHKHGVIHRDVKPSNIMVTSEGRAVLTDFGLALNAQEGTIGNTFGSVHYIAPEQAVSSAQAVPQSDLYSLGVVLYEMLTGRVPFDDVSAMSVALKHISDPPPLPSLLNPDISSQLEEVVIKALDKDPKKRFDTGDLFVFALEGAFSFDDDYDTQELRRQGWGMPPKISTDTKPEKATVEMEVPESLLSSTSSNLLTDSALAKPGTLPFSPIEEERRAEAKKEKVVVEEPESKSSSWIVIGAAVLITAAVILGLVLSRGGSGGDEEGTPTDSGVVAVASEETPTSAVVVVPVDDTEEPEVVTEEPTVRPSDTIEPSDTPTETPESTAEPTDEETPELTAESATSTPEINASEGDTAQLLLRYDGRSILAYNRHATQTINIGNLVFARTTAAGNLVQFNASEWSVEDVYALRSNDCLQLFTVRYTSLPVEDFPSDICRFRQGFRSTVDTFWISSSEDATFEVRIGDRVLATCPTIPSESTDERRCVINLESS